jgi:hypothetical protein
MSYQWTQNQWLFDPSSDLEPSLVCSHAIWEIDQLRVIVPDTTLSQVAETSAVANPEFLKRLLTQLREAGLPE